MRYIWIEGEPIPLLVSAKPFDDRDAVRIDSPEGVAISMIQGDSRDARVMIAAVRLHRMQQGEFRRLLKIMTLAAKE